LSAYDTSALGWRRKFRDVDGDLSRADTNGNTVDETSDDKHANILSSAGDNGANDPDNAAHLDGGFAAKLIREEARDKSTNERATRHGSGDTALDVGLRAGACVVVVEARPMGALIEVTSILLRSDTTTL
jgi:hypothetical protein